MASYEEIYNMSQEEGFRQRVTSAVADVANDVRLEDAGTPNHAERLVWASAAMRNPNDMVYDVIYGVLIANKAYSQEQILNSTDVQIAESVAALVNLFAGV